MPFKCHILSFSDTPYYPGKVTKKTFFNLTTLAQAHSCKKPDPTADIMYLFQIKNRNTISSLLPAAVVMSNRHKHRSDLWKYVLLLPQLLYMRCTRNNYLKDDCFTSETGRIIGFQYYQFFCVIYQEETQLCIQFYFFIANDYFY